MSKMHIRKKCTDRAIRVIASILFLLVMSVLLQGTEVSAAETEQELTILFSHDVHSFLMPKDDGTGEKYGLARMKTLIQERRKENDICILVDAGDFSMGTLYQTLFSKEAVELVMLGEMGYDAVTLGNHEFDYRESGLTKMLYAALDREQQEENLVLPKLLLSNLDWSKNTTEDNLELKKAWDTYGASEYTIVERNGVRIGIFGIFGKDSAEDAPQSGLLFADQIQSAKNMVQKLQDENADVILCLSHSGTWPDPKKSEDELLAEAVPEIDVIVSAHTHTILEEPIVHGSTYIVSCGSYAHYLGELDLRRTADGRYEMTGYTLHPLTGDIVPDEQVTEKLTAYQADINRDYLSRFGYTYDQVIAHNSVEFIPNAELEAKGLEEEPLANLISDAYRYAVEQAEGEDGTPVDVAIVAEGMIRERIPIGDVKIQDVYDVCSLGSGPDTLAGYPMVGIWLNGAELKTMAEIDVSISGGGMTQLFPSGVCWTYNPNRLILNRVTDVSVVRQDGSLEEIDPDRLYHVVTPLYCAQMVGSVQAKSKGILTVAPKNEQGEVITDYEDYIIYNPETGEELKEWNTLATYLESFAPVPSGLPEVPEEYAQLQGRKVMVDSKNPIELLKNPNQIAIVLYCIVVLLIAVIVLVILKIRRHFRKKRQEI